jgi:plasmid stability protein
MAQLVVRNIETSVKTRLKQRARKNGHSMEEEVRDILRDAINRGDAPTPGLGTEIAALFRTVGLKDDIREIIGQPIEPLSFDE